MYEILVVNDGSTDKTDFALELFSDDVTIINNNKNVGLPYSLNKAIKIIKTPLFVRVDGDDYVSRQFLQFLYAFMSENSYMDAVACDYLLVNDHCEPIDRKDCIKYPIACGIIFRTDQIINIGLYDEKFLINEERDLRIRFLKKYKISRLELPLYRYRRHENNMTNNESAVNKFNAKLKEKHE
jgi:glycosyltransferase involved in cell wall biosynthesis